MEQNASTPRGGPQPKRANFGRPLLNDPNIEQTLLLDTTNLNQLLQPEKQVDTSAMNGDDSLDECSFMNDIRSAHTTLELPPLSKSVNLSLVREDEELTLTSITSNSDQKENSGDIQTLLEKCAKTEQELRNMSANLLLSPVQEEMEIDAKDVEQKVDTNMLENQNEVSAVTPQNNLTTPHSVIDVQTPIQFVSKVLTPLQQVSNTLASIQPPALEPVQPTYSMEETREVTQSFCLSPQQPEQVHQVEEVKIAPQSSSFCVQADVHEPKIKEAQTPTNISFGMSPAPAETSKHPNTPMNADFTLEQNGVQPELIQSTLEVVKNATLQADSFVLSPATQNLKMEVKNLAPTTPLSTSLSVQANTIYSEQLQSQPDPTKNITLYDQSFILSPMIATPHLNTSHPNQKSPFAKVKCALGSLIRSPSSKSRKRSITLLNTPDGRKKFEEVNEKFFQAPTPMENTPVFELSKDPEFATSEFCPQTEDKMCMDVANVSAIEATPIKTPARPNLQIPAVTPARGADLNATLSEFVEVSSLVRDIVEAEVPVESEKLDNFSDKLSNLDFMMAEYAVAILNRQPSKVLISEITDHLGDCVRSLIQLVGDSDKHKFQLLIEKERADFEHALNIERQKAKNGFQERQMLCARIDDLELKEQEMQNKINELEDELKRCMESLDEADSLENELLRYKAKCAELETKLKK